MGKLAGYTYCLSRPVIKVEFVRSSADLMDSETAHTGSPPCSTMHLYGDGRMIVSIRLTEDERALAESYARLHSLSLSEAFKRALFEKIEDEYDIMIGQEAYDEYVADQRKSRPVSELWKECDI